MTLDEFDEALLERVTDMTAITEIRFEELAAAYGASVARWPAVAQPSVQALLETSPEARWVLDEAKALDAALDAWEVPQPSQALMARILGDAATGGWNDPERV
jgi:hypothetical protein